MFETDFSHPTCIAPGPASKSDGARSLIEQHLGGLDDDVLSKILNENTARVYRTDGV